VYLSDLEILGFKSFARKTHFVFHNGITGVVGPNGCGKSNIVDAIRWVLGEQKAGALRSERMENVIFNGSKTQKPLGMSEVSLKIQNTRNVLPIEYSEVQITRRLFRSGESQYLLNGTPCRLKDIMDLLMDTGVGANAYSVIELAMVEQILSGKAEERRHIFEEAAGVGKYKARRKAAFRKLEATEQDLVRLNDILSEVEKNVDSLKRQVQKAERYQSYANELRETEVALSAVQFLAIKNELEPLTNNAKDLRDRREQISAQLAAEEAQIEEMRLTLLEVEKQLVARQRDLNANTERIKKKEEQILVSQERIRAVKENRQRFAQEIEELKVRRTMMDEMRTTLSNRLEELTIELDTLNGELNGRQSALGALRERYQVKRQEAKEAESQRMGEVETLNNLHKEAERLRTQIEYNEQRRAELQQEADTWQQRQTELNHRREEVQRQLAATLAQLDHLTLEIEANQQAIAEKETAVANLKEQIMSLTSAVRRHQDRANLLRKFLETYEDHPEGVKHLLLEGGMPEGCLGTLGERIRVPDQYRRAIEAALGEAVVSLLVDTTDRAFEGMDLLRQREKGMVTFLPLQGLHKQNGGMGEGENGGKGEREKGREGADSRVLARAIEAVECDEAMRPLVDNLLDGCYIVSSLTDARGLLEQSNSHRQSFVTLEGEVLTTWGPMRGGDTSGSQESIIDRKTQIQQLEEEVARLQDEIASQNEARERTETELRQLLAKSEELLGQRKQTEGEKQKSELEFGQAVFESNRAEQEIRQRGEELAKLEANQQELRTQFAGIEPRIQELESQRQTAEAANTQLAAELETLEKELRAAEQAANAANVVVVEKRAELRNAQSEIERVANNQRDIADSIQRRTEQIAEAEQQEQELTGQVESLREQLHDDFAERKELEEVVSEIERTFREQKQAADSKERALRSVRSERDEVSENLHKAELHISELTMQRDNLAKHIRETYELDLAQQKAPEGEFDAAAGEERVNWLRNRLKSMGPVNMLALADYEKEKERLDFLTTQKNDLLEAEANLKETIKVINDTAYERFGKVFSQIRENFIQVFKSFFENGEADLRLDEGDPLEADIIIEANPKGKKLGALTLLSGGEKTLTAISLLFAIYLVKPSPFCILDEVDAPLDDMNIGRFVGALRKFSDKTQFIVVTHNKLTMKAADYLYGITMEEQGVSKVVSVKFEDAEVGQHAVAA
jgi:chromosome segregation protein